MVDLTYIRALRLAATTRHALFAVAFLSTLGGSMISPFLVTNLGTITGLTTSEIGFGFGIGVIVGSLVALGLPYFVAERHLKISSVASALLLTSSSLLLAGAEYFAPASIMILVTAAFVMQRMAMNLLISINRSLHLHLEDGVDSKIVFSIIAMVIALGNSVAPPVGAFLIEVASFRACLLASAAVFLGCAVLYLPVIAPADRLDTANDRGAVAATKQVRAAPVLICLSFASATILYAQMFSFIPLSLKSEYENSNAVIRDIFVVFTVVRIAFTLTLYPRIVTFIRSGRSVYCIGVGLSTFAVLAMTWLHAYAWLIVCSALLAVGQALLSTIVIPLLNANISDRSKLTLYMSLATFASNAVGFGLGQTMGVFVFEYLGTTGACLAWMLFSAIALAGMLPARISADV